MYAYTKVCTYTISTVHQFRPLTQLDLCQLVIVAEWERRNLDSQKYHSIAHVYKDIWTPMMGEMQRAPETEHDR